MSRYPYYSSILIVEDDADIVQILREALSDNYTIDSVCDAPSALALLEHGRPGTVVIDYFLPGGGFSEILAKAEAVGSGVVVMSGDSTLMAELSAFGHPCLSKPFRFAELLSAIEDASHKAQKWTDKSNNETTIRW